MVLLFSLFLLFYQADDLQTSKMSAVDFSAVKQGKVEWDQGCFDFYSRQITFRVKNRSDKAIYIYGLEAGGPGPLGSLIRLDREKEQWLDSEGNAWHPSYSDTLDLIYNRIGGHIEVYALPPGKSIKFNDSATKTFLGSRVKRVIYVSLSQTEEPRMVTSEEFILR